MILALAHQPQDSTPTILLLRRKDRSREYSQATADFCSVLRQDAMPEVMRSVMRPPGLHTDMDNARTSAMVTDAIRTLRERGGSSLQNIKKYIEAIYQVDMQRRAPYIRKYLRDAVLQGSLTQTRGRGAAGSFKLTTASKHPTYVAKTAPKAAPKATPKASPKAAAQAAPKATAKAPAQATPKVATQAAPPKAGKADPSAQPDSTAVKRPQPPKNRSARKKNQPKKTRSNRKKGRSRTK